MSELFIKVDKVDIKTKAINSAKKLFNSVKIANIHPSGILATRTLILIIIIPIIVVITQLVLSFIHGDLSPEAARIIDYGIKIIVSIYVPSVLAAFTGFLMLFIDKNNNGIPDKLEENNNNENIH